jgi:UDP-N-acetylglucosamine:LPS N-acetylglucosamine transferase
MTTSNAVKRIVVLTAKAGLGHLSAAKAITAALQETYGTECQIEMLNPLDQKYVPRVLKRSQTDYDKWVRESPKLYKLGYVASDGKAPMTLVDSALTVMLFEAMDNLVHVYQPDVIVTTYPMFQAPLRAVYAVNRRHIPLITVVTDLTAVHHMWFHRVADLCLVPTETTRALAYAAGLSPDKVKIAGIPVHPAFARESRSRTQLRVELGWDTSLTTILVAGGKRVENLPEVLRVLNHSGLPLQLALVAGGDANLYQQFQQTEWHVPTHIYNFVEHMPPLLQAADLIVCKAGGLIVTESLACGLPLMLVAKLPGQEEGNADYVIQHGAGEFAHNPLEALELVHHWLMQDRAGLAKRAEQARQLGRPRAAYEVAAFAWQMAQQKTHHPMRRLFKRPQLSAKWKRLPKYATVDETRKVV